MQHISLKEQLWQLVQHNGINRRRFLQLLSVGGAMAVLAACKGMEMVSDKNDCIVIGSGPVGISAAIRLAEHGLRVLVLEAGTAITEPAGTHFRNQTILIVGTSCRRPAAVKSKR